MIIHLSHRDYLRNFESFLKSFDPTKPEELKITTHAKWVNVHPVVLTMIAALAKSLDEKSVTIEDINPHGCQ